MENVGRSSNARRPPTAVRPIHSAERVALRALAYNANKPVLISDRVIFFFRHVRVLTFIHAKSPHSEWLHYITPGPSSTMVCSTHRHSCASSVYVYIYMVSSVKNGWTVLIKKIFMTSVIDNRSHKYFDKYKISNLN